MFSDTDSCWRKRGRLRPDDSLGLHMQLGVVFFFFFSQRIPAIQSLAFQCSPFCPRSVVSRISSLSSREKSLGQTGMNQ